ncbi:MAG: HlyC/CorC family transporter [bacterium]|nr:HlyC/CorC family transporter [bacterium]
MTEALPWIALGSLLFASGVFSASETALFSLNEGDRQRAGRRVEALLRTPRGLLLTILLCNLVINLAFFTAAPRIAGAGATSSFLALLAVLLFGEILPKTLALRAPLVVSRIASLPLSIAARAVRPIQRLVGGFLDVALRALGEAEREERVITAEALASALEASAAEGIIGLGQAELLAEIVELGEQRVREIMTPRVDMVALDLDESDEEREAKLQEAYRRRLTWLPVVRGGADQVVGAVKMREVLGADRPLEQLVMPVKFVPEVARVLTLLNTLREERIAEAVVIDEWGGTAGVVTLEDLFEEIVGEMRVEGEPVEKPVIPLGEGWYRVSGGLSVHEWNDRLGDEVVPNAFETVGGFVTALLGRLPKAGDRVELPGGLVCEVNEVRGRRVHQLDLYLAGARQKEGEA